MSEESIENYKKQVAVLEQRLAKYENHGGVRLYYSLNRKLNEIADVLNSTNIKDELRGDVKEKAFERLRALWTDAEKIVTATQAIATMLKLTNDEDRDNNKKIPFIETVAETRN
jgi:hypothetical protein